MNNLRLFVLAQLTATMVLGQKYEVHLSQRNRAGDEFLLSAKGTSSEQVSIAGQIVGKEEMSAEFDARAEVLDVDTSGEAVRVAFTVSKFTKFESGATSELLKPGSVVLVDGGAADPVSLKGGREDQRRGSQGV